MRQNSCSTRKSLRLGFSHFNYFTSISRHMKNMQIQRFIEGFNTFRNEYYRNRPDFFRTLVAEGQSPEIMVIACSDSRVDPSIIAKAKPGELFVVRNISNIVPPYNLGEADYATSAAIEFAVRDLRVCDIIVLGHTHCGGLKKLCEYDEETADRQFIYSWMSILPHLDAGGLEGEALLRHIEKEVVKISLNNLTTFPWLNEQVSAGNLNLHGWIFDLEAGVLLEHSPPNEWNRL